MPEEESPAFQWYVKEWRSSRAVMRMTFAQRGMYLEMLNEQWENLTLPDDAAACAELIGGTVAEWTKNWTVLRRKFITVGDGRIQNLRLEKERTKQRSRSKRQSDKGKAGAAARWPKHHTDMPVPLPEIAQASVGHAPPMPNDGFAFPIATAIAIATPDVPAPAITSARSKRPIFTGQKLTVFEWMLDDCVKTLGTLVDAFDLHAWFFELDAAAYRANLVIPKRDNGEWLQAQLVAEAQRRGLPLHIADTPKFGKQSTNLAHALATIKAEAV